METPRPPEAAAVSVYEEINMKNLVAEARPLERRRRTGHLDHARVSRMRSCLGF